MKSHWAAHQHIRMKVKIYVIFYWTHPKLIRVRKAFSSVLMLCNVTGEDIRIKSEKKDRDKI